MKPKVLVTDPSYKHSLAACRALDKAGYEVHTIGPTRGLAGFSRATERHHYVGTDDKSMIDGLRKIIDDSQIDLLLPIGANSVSIISRNRQLFEDKVSFALPSQESIDIALDKGALLARAEEVGVTIPESREFKDESSFRMGIEQLPLPLVVKSSSELRKFGPIYINTEAERELFINGETFLEAFLDTKLLVQNRIVGPGVGFFALYQNGVCKRAFVHQRLKETPESGGSSWAAIGIEHERVMRAGKDLLNLLNWHGPAMVEFKVDSVTGVPILMELNPKFWGSLDLAIASGVDFPSDTCRVALGETLESDTKYKVGVHYVWPLEELKSYLKNKNLRGKNFQSNIDLKDPLPFLVQLVRSLYQAASRKFVPKSWGMVAFWLRTLPLHLVPSRLIGQILGLPLQRHCKINDSLWIGAKPSMLGRAYLKLRGVRSIVSLLANKDDIRGDSSIINIPMPEYVFIPTDELVKHAERLGAILENGPAFVHCREGVGRAPSLAAALLVAKGETLEAAVKLVSAGRSVSRINSQQFASLVCFEKWIRGEPSQKDL
jgi:predicted ATP-grasp superfamily ATP-dependent carboligase